MCGIDGFLGNSDTAAERVSQGLMDLAYRGYDSAGVVYIVGEEADARFVMLKCVGDKSPEELHELVRTQSARGFAALGHNRWATHGAPSERNAHPHLSSNERVAVVHNGVIENFRELRDELQREGYTFRSDTDTEVIPNLIERELKFGAPTLEDAVHSGLMCVKGTYAVGVLSLDHPHEMVAARDSGDLIVGVSDSGLYLTSDEVSLPKDVRLKATLQEGEIVTLRRDGQFHIRGHSEVDNRRRLEKVCVNAEAAGRGNHAHFMIKEILEQPEALRNALRGRIDMRNGTVKLGCFTPEVIRQFRGCERVIVIGCGTSYYSGLVFKEACQRFARVPVEVVLASEYLYSDPIFTGREVVLVISQSGTTADTLNAMRLAQKHGVLCLGITNRVGSTLAREDDGGVYLHAGPEKAVASTKAFTSQAVVLMLMALKIAEIRNPHDTGRRRQLLAELDMLPEKVGEVLQLQDHLKALASLYKNAKRIICLGRGHAVPLAYEGTLKLIEIPYLDAHGYAGGELKHGPLALIEPQSVPVFAIVPKGTHQAKMISNVQEVAAREGEVVAIVTRGDTALSSISKHTLQLPECDEAFISILAAPIFQMMSYYLGVERHSNVDRPRNLAKSVTVE